MKQIVLSALLVYAAVVPSVAQALQYIVKPGDSFVALSQKYYGTKSGAALIAEMNHLKVADAPPSGKPIIIPSASNYRVRPGDSWEKIAKKITKDRRRAAVMAALNGKTLSDPLREGQSVLLPFVVTIRVLDAASPADLARNLYGDAEKASWISDYNFHSSEPFKRGEKVTIPFLFFADPNRVATPSPNTPVVAEISVAALLVQATGLYENAQYSDALALLDRSQRGKIADNEWIKFMALRAEIYVALGLEEAALGAFVEVLKRDANFSLPASTTSPKIIAVLDRAKKMPTAN